MSRQRVDLNLFRVFDAVLRHRSVAGASRDLRVTPSAVSHALARLRQALGDDLFVASETGMAPSRRARDLAPAIRDALALIDEAVGAKPFVAATSARTFRIGATEHGVVTFLAPLVDRLAQAAPNVELRIFPYSRIDMIRHLDEGRLDLVIGWFNEAPERMRRTAIGKGQEAVVVRPGHPLTEGTVTVERLLASRFLVVELTGTEEQALEGFMDDRGVLRRVWIERLLMDRDLTCRIAVSVPYYSAVPPMLAATDLVATLPLSLARMAADQGTLVILDLPYEPLTVQIDALWSRQGEHDPGLQWLVEALVSAASGAG